MRERAMTSKLQKMREIVKVLPKLNCGFCGFGNCGNYAKALVEGEASPGLCIGGPLVAQRICDILGLKYPAMPQGVYSPWIQYGREQELWLLQRRQRELAKQLDNLGRRVKALATRLGR
jgi:Na+-translocating ferredoxin:NAD+ oxidoreductase RNF subunit RnfB